MFCLTPRSWPIWFCLIVPWGTQILVVHVSNRKILYFLFERTRCERSSDDNRARPVYQQQSRPDKHYLHVSHTCTYSPGNMQIKPIGHSTYFTLKLPWSFSFQSKRPQNEFVGCIYFCFPVALANPSIVTQKLTKFFLPTSSQYLHWGFARSFYGHSVVLLIGTCFVVLLTQPQNDHRISNVQGEVELAANKGFFAQYILEYCQKHQKMFTKTFDMMIIRVY